MNHDSPLNLPTRRRFLQSAGMGLGSLALASLLHQVLMRSAGTRS